MRRNEEYNVCKAIATYLRLQYPKVIFHFDYAGLNLSKSHAGMMKAIQGQRGYPDLFISEQRNGCPGLFIEVKKKGTNIFKKNSTEFTTPHIKEQYEMLIELSGKGYRAEFGIGFDECKKLIDEYLN